MNFWVGRPVKAMSIRSRSSGIHSTPASVTTKRRPGCRSKTPPKIMHQSGRCVRHSASCIVIASPPVPGTGLAEGIAWVWTGRPASSHSAHRGS